MGLVDPKAVRPRILVGVTGSIAAYRSPDFVKELIARGYDVRVVLTRAAAELVSSRVLETFSQAPVARDAGPQTFGGQRGDEATRLGAWADLAVVYAASADALHRYAQGLPEDTLTTELLGFSRKVILAPAMNPAMWEHPAVGANVARLRERGVLFAGPVGGVVACGEVGVGHVAAIDFIADAIARELDADAAAGEGDATPHDAAARQAWRGRKVLISAGPMRSRLDPVRYLQNRSSGLMGLELARAARRAGAEVTVLLGPVEDARRREFGSFAVTSYESAEDYGAQLRALLPGADVFFSAAAVLDFTLEPATQKLARSAIAAQADAEGRLELRLAARPTRDFVREAVELRAAAGRQATQTIIAFAAETGDDAAILQRAREKMLKKGADAMLANPVTERFGPEATENRMWLLVPDQESARPLGPAPKAVIAREVVTALEPLLNKFI